MRVRSSRPFCSCDGRWVSLGYLSAASRYTTHDQQILGNKGLTATPTAAVVLALFAQVALIQLGTDDQQIEQLYGVQPHHLLLCDALGLNHAWYEAPSAQKNGTDIQTP
jgi:hypothetical protein